MALAAYRHLLRATRIAFQGIYPSNNSTGYQNARTNLTHAGDIPTFQAARSAARDSFAQNRQLQRPESSASIQHAEDVAKILREQVIQGKAVEGDKDRFKLRIHEHIERGDNESIKVAGKESLAGQQCCSA